MCWISAHNEKTVFRNIVVIVWPVVIKYEGESELTFVSSQSQWDCDADLHHFSYETGDMLIDSEGAVYELQTRESHCIIPTFSGLHVNQQEVLGLVKAHLSEIGQCCVAKFSINTIAQGILAVGFEDKHY
jgi:hypothetical protein